MYEYRNLTHLATGHSYAFCSRVVVLFSLQQITSLCALALVKGFLNGSLVINHRQSFNVAGSLSCLVCVGVFLCDLAAELQLETSNCYQTNVT